jgi:hypothetical protein
MEEEEPMKTWIITLPFLCATTVAMAQGADQPAAVTAQNEPVVVPAEILTPAEPAAVEAAPDAVEAAPAVAPKANAPMKRKAAAKRRTSKRGSKTLPTGDMRHCLDMKTSQEIIRCSETRRKK